MSGSKNSRRISLRRSGDRRRIEDSQRRISMCYDILSNDLLMSNHLNSV